MSIEVVGPKVTLSGRCGPEESEPLLAALSAGAKLVDLTGCEHLHAALVQLLMASGVTVTGVPSDPVVRWILPLLTSRSP